MRKTLIPLLFAKYLSQSAPIDSNHFGSRFGSGLFLNIFIPFEIHLIRVLEAHLIHLR